VRPETDGSGSMRVVAILRQLVTGPVSSRSPAMIPRLPVPPKGFSLAIAKRVEAAVENCGRCKKHYSNHRRQGLLKTLLPGEVQGEAVVVDRVGPPELGLRLAR
jgi:hypothetical protein